MPSTRRPIRDEDADWARRRERLESNPDNESDEAHARLAQETPDSTARREALAANPDVASDVAHDTPGGSEGAARREALGSNPDVEADETDRSRGADPTADLDDERDRDGGRPI